MSLENLLDDVCDIYHLKSKEQDQKHSYGVPIEDRQKEYYYEDEPDLTDVSCYLVESSQSIVQDEPNPRIVQVYNGYFDIDTDIRINSKISWNGITLKAQLPRVIKNHHKKVTLIRDENI